MKWTIGIGIKPGHQGPLGFMAWLCKASLQPAGESVVACHVTPPESWLARVFHGPDGERQIVAAQRRARELCDEVFDRAGVATMLHRIEICAHDTIYDGLASVSKTYDSEALVIGRHARSDENDLVRLGPIARKCLARCPGPLVVVPPEYRAPRGETPAVVLLTDLEPHSEAAADMAQHIARQFGLELHLVHVTKPVSWSVPYIPESALSKASLAAVEAATLRVRAWLDARRLAVAKAHVLSGDPTRTAAALLATGEVALAVTGW
ncbi:MAG: universal stress protein [Nannocystaceae bacterium]